MSLVRRRVPPGRWAATDVTPANEARGRSDPVKVRPRCPAPARFTRPGCGCNSGPASPDPHVVAVVGGGVSGLTAAWRLSTARPASDVVLLEGRDAVGGVVRVGDVGGVRLDLGAESLLARRPEAVELAREAGLGDDLVHPATSSAAVVARGTLGRCRPAPCSACPATPRPRRRPHPGRGRPRRRRARPAARAADRRRGRRELGRRPGRTGRRRPPGRAAARRGLRRSRGAAVAARDAAAGLGRRHPRRPCSTPSPPSSAPAPPAVSAAGVRGHRGRRGPLAEALAGGLAARGVEIRTRTTVRGLRRRPAAGGWSWATPPAPAGRPRRRWTWTAS